MENKSSKGQLINIPALISTYRKYWYLIILSVIFFAGLGVVMKVRQQSRSEVVAQVLISDEKSSRSMGNIAAMFGGGGSFGANRSIEDEMVIVKAHSLLRETVVELGLNVDYKVRKNFLKVNNVYNNPPVRLIYDNGIADTLGVMLRFDLKVDKDGMANVKLHGRKNALIHEQSGKLPLTLETAYGQYTLVEGSMYKPGKKLDEKIFLSSYDGAALDLSSEIAVSMSEKKTDIMMLSLLTTDADFGKLVLNTLVANYNKLTVEQKRNFNRKTLQFIEDRIKLIAAEVDSTQSDVQAFLDKENLVNPQAQASIILNRTTAQEVELVKSETEYDLLNMSIEFLSNEANNNSMLPVMPSTGSLTPLITGYNELILKRIEIESSAKGDNVALKALNLRIKTVRDNLLTALNKRSETAAYEIAELRRQYNNSKTKLGEVPTLEREYTNIMRQKSLKEQLYVYLLQQREETDMAIQGAHPRGVIIDEAYVTDAVLGMSASTILLVFMMLGFLMPAAVIIAWWLLSRKISLASQAVEISGGSPLIGEIITLPAGDQPVVTKNPGSEAVSRYNFLRNNLLEVCRVNDENRCSVVAVTPTYSDATCGSIATNLALSLAMTSRRTLLIDADVFNCPVADILGIRSDEASLQENIYSDGKQTCQYSTGYLNTSLDVMMSEKSDNNASELLSSVKLARMVDVLKRSYDVIIINMPSVSDDFAAAESACSLCDINVAVVKTNVSLKAIVKKLTALPTLSGGQYLISVD